MKSFERTLISIVFILFALSLSIILTIFISPFIYSLAIRLFSLDVVSGLSPDQLIVNYRVILEYLSLPNIPSLEMPYFSASSAGLQHFVEVKNLIMANYMMAFLLFVLSIWGIIRIHRQQWQVLMRPYYAFAIMLPLIILFGIIIAFDQVFLIFHKLLFNNDLWLFNPSLDPVITVLPQELFMVLFILALVLYELIILFIGLLTRWKR